ncbi:MAG: dihydrofolate reductase [Candidatus Acidiferrum sp.]
MLVSAIVAMDRRGLIGSESGLPWHLPSDLRRFRRLTMGNAIIMGRATYQFLGQPLPGRLNIVLSRQSAFQAPGCLVVDSLDAALCIANSADTFIIGGGQLYRTALPRCGKLYLTIVDGEFAGTTYFPCDFVVPGSWAVRSDERIAAGGRDAWRSRFFELERSAGDFELSNVLTGEI